MAAKPKAGTTQINVELDPALLDRVKRFVEERGQTLKYVVGRALTRHLDCPPPLAPEPTLPTCEPDCAPVKVSKPRGKKRS